MDDNEGLVCIWDGRLCASCDHNGGSLDWLDDPADCGRWLRSHGCRGVATLDEVDDTRREWDEPWTEDEVDMHYRIHRNGPLEGLFAKPVHHRRSGMLREPLGPEAMAEVEAGFAEPFLPLAVGEWRTDCDGDRSYFVLGYGDLCRPGQAWAMGTHERRLVRVRVLPGGWLALLVVEGDV
jgi:hypothetical protein